MEIKRKMSVGQKTKLPRAATAADIEQMLGGRIRKGAYPEGEQLPTVRALADELRVNKNTVMRAYQALERRGYLELTRGRGAFVRQREPTMGVVDSRWLARLDQLLTDAQRHELSRDLVQQELTRCLDHVFGHGDLRVAFVECNLPDIEAMSVELHAAVSHPLKGVLLSDLLARPKDVAHQFDLIVTTFYHLSEVGKALGTTQSEQLVGVHATPTHDALLKIARLHAQVIGLVCDRASTIDNLKHIIHTYHPAATIMPTLIDDKPQLKQLLKQADALVVTRSCHEQLMAYKPKRPVIMVVFALEQQSVDFLRTKIEEQLSERLDVEAR
jgi:DNA-binding transcriptional regulator YhcF (GntR family)